ncbi:glycoside hydrolase [Saccharicrinis sp. FJH54]|uniref:glycoside hydrolase n=1 Tax=Saccharicrinis sp. FJH54 TaxID=3344665 RepID=UPI0035D50C9C
MKQYYAILIVVLLSVFANLSAQNINIKPDPSKEYQTIEGWGSSLCWWAHMVGQWDDEAKIDEIVDLITSPDKLNMNIFRYNIGGGDDPSHYSTPGNPGHMADGKGVRAEMEGFKPGENEPYDWTADAGQRKIMLKIKAKRPDAIFEAFSNSPPYWMTYSGCSAGNNPAGSDNLKPEYYGQFCDYLVEVCKHYKDKYGIEFKTLEPFNESLSSYWGYLGGQEGCHFDASTQIAVIRELYPRLQASGLNTVISASDETNISSFIYAMNAYITAGDIIPKLGQINTHTYSGSDPERVEAHNLSRTMGKTLWQSETGPSGFSGSGIRNNLQLAQRMFSDLTIMKPSAWIDWQLMEEWNDNWCQMRCSFADETYYTVKNFYVRMQVTRFVKQGYRILESGAPNILTAISPDNKELVMVVLNQTDSDQNVSADLSEFGMVAASATVYRTSSSEDCSKKPDQAITESKLSYVSPAQSITTFIIPVTFTNYAQFRLTEGITFEDQNTEGFSGTSVQLSENGAKSELNSSRFTLSAGDNVISYETGQSFVTTAEYRYLHIMTRSGIHNSSQTATGDTILLESTDTWQDQVIDFGINTSFSKLIFKAVDPGNRLTMDNLIMNNDPDPRGVTEVAPFFDFESASGVPVMNRIPFENGSAVQVSANSDIVGMNVSGHILEYLYPMVANSTVSEDTLLFTLYAPLKISEATAYFHMLVKSPERKINVTIGQISREVSVTQGEWTDVVIDLTGLLNQVIGSVQISPLGSVKLNTIMYLDDITFNANSEPRTYVFEAPENGTYIIYSRNSNNVITVNGDGDGLIQDLPDDAYQNQDQLWDFTATEGGYTISNTGSGKVMTDEDAYLLALIEPAPDKDGQIFTVSETDGGYVKIVSVKTGKALDVESESTAAGANIGLWDFGSTNNYHRQWALVKIAGADALQQPKDNNAVPVQLIAGKGQLTFFNAEISPEITIYTVNGRMIKKLHHAGQMVTIQLKPGVYISQIKTISGIFSLKALVY